MTDRYGRKITYLRLSVTELCNLRCRYCMPENGICKKSHAAMLTEEEMIRAVEAAAELGIYKLRITGGEPLVKKNILSICEKASAIDGIEEVCITTNGIQLPRYAGQLRAVGVRRINLSLDTLNAEKYAHITRLGTLQQAMDGLYAALDAGFEKIKINTVLIGGFNDDEIATLAELTKQYPIDVRFIELMPVQKADEFGEAAFIPCKKVIEKLPDMIPQRRNGEVARLYRLPGAMGNIGLISPLSDHFCGSCNRIRLTADGKLKPCLHCAAEYAIKGLEKSEMLSRFKKAIREKPACHGELSAKQRSQAGRNMNQIGG